MRQPYRIVPDAVSKDTIECLEVLLDHARCGTLIGMAFAAMYKGRKCITNTAGECARSPLFTRGLVASLDDEVRKQMHR